MLFLGCWSWMKDHWKITLREFAMVCNNLCRTTSNTLLQPEWRFLEHLDGTLVSSLHALMTDAELHIDITWFYFKLEWKWILPSSFDACTILVVLSKWNQPFAFQSDAMVQIIDIKTTLNYCRNTFFILRLRLYTFTIPPNNTILPTAHYFCEFSLANGRS